MKPWSLSKKRWFGSIAALILLILSPMFFFIFRNPLRFANNLLAVIFQKIDLIALPGITSGRKGIIKPFENNIDGSNYSFGNQDMDYLKHYSMQKDLELLLSHFNSLDRDMAGQG
jgi:hypothetical protein